MSPDECAVSCEFSHSVVCGVTASELIRNSCSKWNTFFVVRIRRRMKKEKSVWRHSSVSLFASSNRNECSQAIDAIRRETEKEKAKKKCRKTMKSDDVVSLFYRRHKNRFKILIPAHRQNKRRRPRIRLRSLSFCIHFVLWRKISCEIVDDKRCAVSNFDIHLCGEWSGEFAVTTHFFLWFLLLVFCRRLLSIAFPFATSSR